MLSACPKVLNSTKMDAAQVSISSFYYLDLCICVYKNTAKILFFCSKVMQQYGII